MDNENLRRELHRALEDMPRQRGIMWDMALIVTMMEALNERFPGFRNDIRTRLERSAERMEQSDDPDHRADAPSLRELVASWVFPD